jgi:hypothetical protein
VHDPLFSVGHRTANTEYGGAEMHATIQGNVLLSLERPSANPPRAVRSGHGKQHQMAVKLSAGVSVGYETNAQWVVA